MTPDADPQSQFPRPWLKKYPVDIDWNVEMPVSTLVDDFENSVKKYGNRTCLNFMGKKMTYQEVGAAVDRFAKGLQDQGVVKGTKVGLCLPNTPFYAIAYYGALKAGATVVNFNPLYAEKEMEHQIQDSQTEIMVTTNLQVMYPNVERTLGKTPLQKIVVCDFPAILPGTKKTAVRVISGVRNAVGAVFGSKTSRNLAAWLNKKGIPVTAKIGKNKNIVSFDQMLKAEGALSPVEIKPDDVAVFQYTGGTTGVPKAAMLTHENLSANLYQANLWFTAGKEPPEQEKMLAVLPFFHVFSMTAHLNLALNIGAELVMLPKFNLTETLETITKEKPTIFGGVPTLYKAIIDCPDIGKYDLSSLKICISGGASLPETTMTGFKKLTGIDLVEGYGLSETSPLATANPINGEKKVNSIGIPVPNTEIRIDTTNFPDQDTPVHLKGEICINGPQVMKGYWNRPDETEKVMDKQGFFHTGDVGYMDEDGYVFIVDRIKDMINASGMKVFPRKVEEAILQHPDVSEVIVAGVKDDYRGENVKAFMVLKPGKTVTEKDMSAFLRDKLASYEMPKLMDFRESLPKTMIGKPDRKALLAEEAKKEAQKPSAPKPPRP